MIFDGKISENCGLERVSGTLGIGLAGLVVDFRARSPPREPQDFEFESILRATWVQVGAKMAEVVTNIAILVSFWRLFYRIFRLLSPIFAEMGEVEKRTTVQHF